MVYWKCFLLCVHDPSRFALMWGAPAVASVQAHVCVFGVWYSHRPTLGHMPLTVGLFLETAALVTLRHSHSLLLTHTHTHTHPHTPTGTNCWGSFFFSLESNSWVVTVVPPHHYLLALPCGAHRLKRRVWIATVTLPDFNALFGNSAPPWFWTWGRIIWQDARVRICRIVTAMSTGRTNLRIYVKTFFFKTAFVPNTSLQSWKSSMCFLLAKLIFSLS